MRRRFVVENVFFVTEDRKCRETARRDNVARSKAGDDDGLGDRDRRSGNFHVGIEIRGKTVPDVNERYSDEMGNARDTVMRREMKEMKTVFIVV